MKFKLLALFGLVLVSQSHELTKKMNHKKMQDCSQNDSQKSHKINKFHHFHANSLHELSLIKRNINGSQNNQKYPNWGKQGQNILRLSDNNYVDGKSKVYPNLPNVRQVSNTVGQIQGKMKLNINNLNMLFNNWGQFITHQIVFIPSTKDQQFPIYIPKCDKYMDPECKGTQKFSFNRAVYNPKQQIRTNINTITPWIDGGVIYGPDQQKADLLRTFKDGKLKTDQNNLPIKNQKGQFLAGDIRVNQNVALTVLNAIFIRQHNRICDIILKKKMNLCDEEIYQIAKNYVIGLLQHITYDEYLPLLLGDKYYRKLIGEYRYQPKQNPQVFAQFAGAAYRFGHQTSNTPFRLIENNGRIKDILQFGEMFNNAKLITPEFMEQLINGLIQTKMKQRDLTVVNQIRNFFTFINTKVQKLDLYSIDLQRGRDMGLAKINDIRQVFEMKCVKKFNQLFQNCSDASKLQKLYQQIDKVDLYLAIIGQQGVKGSPLGQLGIKINALQFRNIRNSDRFWYEHAYPQEIVKQIKKTTLYDILNRNLWKQKHVDKSHKCVFVKK